MTDDANEELDNSMSAEEREMFLRLSGQYQAPEKHDANEVIGFDHDFDADEAIIPLEGFNYEEDPKPAPVAPPKTPTARSLPKRGLPTRPGMQTPLEPVTTAPTPTQPPLRPEDIGNPDGDVDLDTGYSNVKRVYLPEEPTKTPPPAPLGVRRSLPTRPGQVKPHIEGEVVRGEYLNVQEEQVILSGDTYDTLGIYTISAEDLLNNDYAVYERLQDKVIETKNWIQDVLKERDQTRLIGEARQKRGKKYVEMAGVIARLLTQRFATGTYQVRREDQPVVISLVINEMLGLGPIEPLWGDGTISEIMVNGPKDVRIERRGKIEKVPGAQFRDETHLMEVCQQILSAINKTIDVAHPLEDGRLPDGSRVNITHPSVSPGGPYVTIRRFPETVFSVKRLVDLNSMTPEIAEEIGNLIAWGLSCVIVGGTGTGKLLSLDTLIPTPTGMTTMGELQEGDIILDENSEPTMVTAKYSTKIPVAYELTFSDGTKVKADEDHNWFTSTRSARRAVSRQETSKKMVNAQRKQMGTPEELAALWSMYNSREEVLSPSQVVRQVPRLRTVVYNAAKLLTPTSRTTQNVFYDARDLLTNVIERSSRVLNDQRYRSAVESVVTTKEIYNTLKTGTGHTNHAVRMISKPVPYSTKELPITPYAFGAWLGDGHSRRGAVCGIDDEVFDFIIEEGNVEVNVSYDTAGRRKTPLRLSTYDNWRNALKDLGVLKTSTEQGETKFIPDEYLYSDEAQRRALVAGMLDTDGTVDRRTGNVTFTNSNKRIIDGFRQVIHSLGYQSTVTSRVPTYTHKGEKRQGQVSYTVSFFTKDDVFRLTRKAELHAAVRKEKQAGHRSEWRYIVDCQPVESVPMACITVDSPKSLYLCTDAFIPTHNTSMLNALSGCIPDNERIISIEDNLELRLHPRKHWLAMEARKAHQGDRGTVAIRDLVRNALRQRPDRIVVGEVRDGAAFDMLQAMSTGHDGSLTTVHANNSTGAVTRLINLVASVGEIDTTLGMSLIASAVDLFIVIARFEDGSRRVVEISEVPQTIEFKEGNAVLEPRILWEFVRTGTEEVDGKERVVGEYRRVNELSEKLVEVKSLDKRHRMSLEEIYRSSEQEGQ